MQFLCQSEFCYYLKSIGKTTELNQKKNGQVMCAGNSFKKEKQVTNKQKYAQSYSQ